MPTTLRRRRRQDADQPFQPAPEVEALAAAVHEIGAADDRPTVERALRTLESRLGDVTVDVDWDAAVAGGEVPVAVGGNPLTAPAVTRALGAVVRGAALRWTAQERQSEADQDLDTMGRILRSVSEAGTRDEALRRALDGIRVGFGWAYGSFWAVDPDANVLRFAVESGDAGPAFREVTLRSSFAPGVGLSGRTWARRDMVFVSDLGEMVDCVRAPVAQAAGVKSGVCLPIIVGGDVVGTMDFFATETLTLQRSREEALRNTAFLLSQALERLAVGQRLQQAGETIQGSIRTVEENVAVASSVAEEGRRVTYEASELVTGLGRSSAEIGQVVSTIRKIAA